MPAPAKPGVNWREIEISVRGGMSPSALGRRHGVSRQAIERRAKRHEWKPDPEAEALATTDTAERITAPKTRGDRKLVADGRRTLENMQAIVEELTAGGTRPLAAQRVGTSPAALRTWGEEDPEFERLMAAAEAEAALRRVGRIEDAADRGDWKADAWLLERSKTTRDEFAVRQPTDPLGGGGVTIQLVFANPEHARKLGLPCAPVIEGTAEPEADAQAPTAEPTQEPQPMGDVR